MWLAHIQFMYSCVMGLTAAEAQGCILADEMGLGKTLQTIALIQTLLSESHSLSQSYRQNNPHSPTNSRCESSIPGLMCTLC